jgi:hypothetical protein
MMLRFELMLQLCNVRVSLLCYAMERLKLMGKDSISMTSFALALLPFDLSLFLKDERKT